MLTKVSVFAALLGTLAACSAATQYDSGAVVLEVTEPGAFSASSETTPEFVSAYDALKVNDFTRAEALLDQALISKPKDPYALLAMGSVHERTGRFYSAAEYYRSAERYGESASDDSAMTVADAARKNLSRLTR